MRPGTEVSSDAGLRLAVLLLALAGLVYYAVNHWPWDGAGDRVAAAASSDCPSGGAPELRTIDLDRVGELRESIASEVLFGAHLDTYEEGFVGTYAPWNDDEPTMQPVGESEQGVPAGYEIRWWTPTRHDVVADVWLFEDAAAARDFAARASSTRCRSGATAEDASAPPGGRNLEWKNPFGFVQQDLFLARGPRVYRLSVVPPGEDGKSTAAERRQGFALVDALGCSVLDLDCRLPRSLPGGSAGGLA